MQSAARARLIALQELLGVAGTNQTSEELPTCFILLDLAQSYQEAQS